MDVGPARLLRSPLVFQVGAEPHFPRLERFPTTPQLFLPVYSHVNVELPGPPAAALPASCSLACPAPQSASLLGPPATTLP